MSHKIETTRVLEAAAYVAKRQGFSNITREAIAKKAGVSSGTVSHAFGTMVKLKRSVMRYAIQNEILSIIAEGLGIKDKTAMKIDSELKAKALATLL